MPGLKQPFHFNNNWQPVMTGGMLWAAHSALFALLLASSLIDAEHRIIPTTITYPGTLLGLVCSVVMPWPWPSDPALMPVLTNPDQWFMPQYEGKILHGLQLWPAVGPPPSWAPGGSWQLGLLNGVIGAAVGMMAGRGLKFLYESARGKEALGLGDADLLMMIGAFLGWQVALFALPFGAVCSLVFAVPRGIYQWLTKKPIDPALPFGPGIAIAAGLMWLTWPRLNESLRMTFDFTLTAIAIGVVAVGLGAFGLMLRGRN
jgi:leader peptidase (prepilin peptidase)/N-methyltransferase